MAESDIWSEWLLRRRSGNDQHLRQRIMETLLPIRDRVIDGARIREGDTVLDVGCGDGLIGFGVLQRHPGVRVIFADISGPLLESCSEFARASGLEDRCSYVECSADDLDQVASESVDAVVLRSVLMYVPNRPAAHCEAFRVLRRGGRLSYFEPANAFGPSSEPEPSFWGYPSGPLAELTGKVGGIFAAALDSASSRPVLEDRELVDYAVAAGFDLVAGSLEIRASRSIPEQYRMTWQQWLGQTGNPLIPSVGEAVDRALSTEERAAFERHFRPLVESGAGAFRNAGMYLTALKPE